MKYIKILLVAILMFLCVNTSVEADDSKFQGNLELEDQVRISSDQILIVGWAIYSEGIKQIRVYLDDTLKGQAEYGLKREDVAKIYPSIAGAENSGFQLELDLSGIKPGTHTIRVDAVFNSGKSVLIGKKHLIKPEPPKSEINSPKEKFTIAKGRHLAISGWIDGKSMVKSVQIWLDDHFVDNAKTGILRNDLRQQYPDLPKDSGFEYKLDITKAYRGTHTIKIIAEMNDGTTVELGSRSFRKPFNYPMLILLIVFVLVGIIYYRFKKVRTK